MLQVAEEAEYNVAMGTRHAVLEQQRGGSFQQLLQGPLTMPEQLLNLGELLFQVCLLACLPSVLSHQYSCVRGLFGKL